MSKIDHAKRNEVGILQRELRQVNTYSGSGGDGSHPGNGTDSVALGASTVADGYGSVAVGESAEAQQDASIALGSNAHAEGVSSAALGASAFATATASTALGAGAEASHSRSTAVGRNATTTAVDQVALGDGEAQVYVPGFFRVASHPPASSSSAGFVGQLTWDSGFLYVCVAANSWRRIALSTF